MQVRIDPQELGVVVQHLLEVGDHPVRASTEYPRSRLPAGRHAAAGHRLAGALGHEEGVGGAGAPVVSEQELEHHRRQELGRPAESASRLVEPAEQPGDRAGQDRLVDRQRRWCRADLVEPCRDRATGPQHVLTLVGPCLAHGLQELEEVVAGEVGAAVERLPAGVRKQVMGHPPWPVSAVVAVM